MTSPPYSRVKELFLEACELPLDERSSFLDSACTGDEQLRHAVEALLAFDGAGSEASSVLQPPHDAPPERVGPYRLVRKVGEGGMGEVWEAEQDEPVRRRVALKLIRWGMDSREVVARFESERQALALMDHPNVARAYDAGWTDQGRPFFSMEFVDGVPLTDYCDAQRLSSRERLQLFVQICHGVQHAHHRGVIHRDIKPSNILVTQADGRPEPKIIDFGVAKAVSQRLTERTLFTQLGQWIGTPEYMSPEQAGLTLEDVDTRTDVYSLGAVLYELLAGTQPFDPEELRSAGLDEMRRRIREDDPPRPSTRVSSLGDDSRLAAEHRRTNRNGLVRTLRGDLDWIVMRAMEKDRTQRYGSPSELAGDVARHLANQPVVASPPSGHYRLRKFVRRHRVGVATSAVVAAALVAGVVGTGVGLVRAQREADTARRVSELLVGVFADIDPAGQLGHLPSPTAMLDRGAERILLELDDQPLVQARLLHTLGAAYLNLARYDEAQPLLEEALRLRENSLGGEHTQVGDTCVALGWLWWWRGDFGRSRASFERAATVYAMALGDHHPAVANSRALIGGVDWRTGDYERARQLLEGAMELLHAQGLDDDPVAVTTTYPYSILLMELGEHDAACPLLEQAVALRERAHGPDHANVSWVVFDLGRCYQERGRIDEARQMYERALAIQERAFGPDHPAVALTLTNIAVLDREAGDFEVAHTRLKRALSIRERAQGLDSPDLVWTLMPYATVLVNLGEVDRARAALDRALAIVEAAHGPVHVDVARVIERMGFLHYQLGENDRALEYYRRALAIREAVFGSEHVQLGWNLYDQACMAALEGDREQALGLLKRAVDCGWAHPRIFEDDDLDTLLGDPEFEAVLARVREGL